MLQSLLYTCYERAENRCPSQSYHCKEWVHHTGRQHRIHRKLYPFLGICSTSRFRIQPKASGRPGVNADATDEGPTRLMPVTSQSVQQMPPQLQFCTSPADPVKMPMVCMLHVSGPHVAIPQISVVMVQLYACKAVSVVGNSEALRALKAAASVLFVCADARKS